MSERHDVRTSDGVMPAHVWSPSSGSGPGILLLQEIFGVSSYVERRAQDLAELGYVVLAPEIFWRLGVSRVEEGPDALEKAFGLLQQVDWRAAVTDGINALEALQQHPARSGGAGIVGFCFGGGLGFNIAAESEPDVLVSYYGSALPELLGLAPPDARADVYDATAVKAPSLHHFGLSDSFIERSMVEQIRAKLSALDNVTFESYEHADHAFDNDDLHFFDEEASRLAWATTEEWLSEHLPVA